MVVESSGKVGDFSNGCKVSIGVNTENAAKQKNSMSLTEILIIAESGNLVIQFYHYYYFYYVK